MSRRLFSRSMNSCELPCSKQACCSLASAGSSALIWIDFPAKKSLSICCRDSRGMVSSVEDVWFMSLCVWLGNRQSQSERRVVLALTFCGKFARLPFAAVSGAFMYFTLLLTHVLVTWALPGQGPNRSGLRIRCSCIYFALTLDCVLLSAGNASCLRRKILPG